MAEWQARSSLYDEFKITSLKLKYKPYYTESTLNTQYSPQSAISNVDIYTIIDRDGTSVFSASLNMPAKLAMYDSYQRKPFNKPWSRSLTTSLWMNTASVPVAPGTVQGNQGLQYLVNGGALQEMMIYCYNLPQVANQQAWGQITVEFNVCFRGKKPTSLSYDPVSGSTIITPLSSFTHATDLLIPQNVGPLPQNDANLVIDEGAVRVQLTGPFATGTVVLAEKATIDFCTCTGPTGPTGPGLIEVEVL